MALSTKTSRIVIVGRVQGVGFRAFLAREAMRLNLSGWARNRGVSEVEALVSGDAAAVARVSGPCAGVVREADVAKIPCFTGPNDDDSRFDDIQALSVQSVQECQ